MGPVAYEKSLFSQEYAGILTHWSQGNVNHMDKIILKYMMSLMVLDQTMTVCHWTTVMYLIYY